MLPFFMCQPQCRLPGIWSLVIQMCECRAGTKRKRGGLERGRRTSCRLQTLSLTPYQISWWRYKLCAQPLIIIDVFGLFLHAAFLGQYYGDVNKCYFYTEASLLPVLSWSIREKMKHNILTTGSGQIHVWSPIMLTREKNDLWLQVRCFIMSWLGRTGKVLEQCFNSIRTEEIVKFSLTCLLICSVYIVTKVKCYGWENNFGPCTCFSLKSIFMHLYILWWLLIKLNWHIGLALKIAVGVLVHSMITLMSREY